MRKVWTVGKRTYAGYGVILGLLIVVGGIAYWGTATMAARSDEGVERNELSRSLIQREIDHLNWANQVNALLTDDSVTELHVQTDPTQCAFGKWYYSDERRQAEAMIPGLSEILAKIDQPHAHLHESAKEIGKVFVQADKELSGFLREKKIDHLNWMHKVKDAMLDSEKTATGVEADPTRCGLGRWILSERTVALTRQDSDFATKMKTLVEHHNALHGSTQAIDAKLAAADREGARQEYMTSTEPAAHRTLATVDELIVWSDAQMEGMSKANNIYAAKTKPALHSVQEALGKASDVVEKEVQTSNKQLRDTAGQTQLAAIAVSAISFVLGCAIAVLLARSLVKVLRGVSHRLAEGSRYTRDAAGQVSSSSQGLANNASELAASVEESTASTTEVAAMATQNADRSNSARQAATEVHGEANRGIEAVKDMSEAIHEIKHASDETAKIIKTIDGIAFQTNLLALNAAVEAARAGDAGRGFAVVANEVRELATRCADAAKSTEVTIEQAIQRSERGVEASNRVSGVLAGIVERIQQVSELVAGIAASTEEQAAGVEQIDQALTQVSDATQRTSAEAEESAAAAEELSAQSDELNRIVRDLEDLVGISGEEASNGFVAEKIGRQPKRREAAVSPSSSSKKPGGLATTPMHAEAADLSEF
jgi:methyl-accepting chemotaxis protein